MPDEPGWIWILVCLGSGFVLLAKGADWLVEGSSAIARRIGISIMIVGLTVVAFGTSAPEIVVSSLAAVEGHVDLSLGNVLGSNIANIGLVLGACAIVLPVVLESRLGLREFFWLLASLILLWWMAGDRCLTRPEAVTLLAAFVLYNLQLLLAAGRQVGSALEPGPEEREASMARSHLYMLLGIGAILLGAWLVLDGSVAGAQRLGVPESVVGLTVVALGTSLPELAAGLGGAFKGESEISIGNVIGSNVFNLMGVMGIVGVIQPLDPDHPAIGDPAKLLTAFDRALAEDFGIVAAFSLAAIVLPVLKGGGRAKGIFLVTAYLAYNGWLYATRSFDVAG